MEHILQVTKNARYFSEGNSNGDKLLIVFHGYGQLAYYFIRKFSAVYDNWHVVAPEGLHRFYTNGSSGRVGASWMTKEAREQDIEDNINWITQLVEELTSTHTYKEIVLLGFSQGATTAARYFYSEQKIVDRLIIWASVLPPDINKRQLFQKNNESGKKNIFVLGTTDQFFTTEQQVEALQFFSELGYETVTFEGNHDIDAKTLQNIL